MADFPISLGVRSNPTRRGYEGNAVITNARAEDVGEEGKSKWVLYSCSGFQAFVVLSGADGPLKAALEMDGTGYVVAGTKLYSVTSGGTATLLGTLTGATGIITMAANRRSPNRQIAIVSSNGLWWILENGTLTAGASVDADLAAPNSVTEQNGYFIFTHADGQFTTSGANASTIDPLEKARAEANADGLVRGMRVGNYIVLAGTKSTEYWQDVGEVDFAFSPQQAIDFGCYAAGSMCDVTLVKEDQEVTATLAMVATNSQGAYAGVVLVKGYSAIKISTPAVDRVIEAETDPTIITGDFYIERGHAIYTLSGTDWTWEYDLSTGLWNPRKSSGLDRWRVRTFFKLGSKTICGDYSTSGVLYQALPTLFTEAGTDITCTLQPPPVTASPYQLQINALYLDVIPQTGITFADSPTVSIQYSGDGGATFSTARTSKVGASGRPLTKVVERTFGLMPEGGVTWKFSWTAAKLAGLVGGMIEAERSVRAA